MVLFENILARTLTMEMYSAQDLNIEINITIHAEIAISDIL